MKATPAAQRQLLELQALDTRLDQLAHREKALPESVELAAVEQSLDQLQAEVATAQVEVTDVSRALERAENEVQQVRQRATRDQELLDSGRITVSKQLSELQHEITSLARRQTELEDAELEIMESAEQAQELVSRLTELVDSAQARRDDLQARRDVALVQIRGEVDACTIERAEVVSSVSADLLALYEKIRRGSGGVGAAGLKGNRCQGCNMQLSPIDLAAMEVAPADEVQRCENCSRILVRPVEARG